MGVRSLTAVIHRESEEFVAICPEVGTASRGKDPHDAVERLRLATELAVRDSPFPKDEDDASPVFITQFQIVTPDDTVSEITENQ